MSTNVNSQGDFPLTAIAIAREVGIITTRAEDIKGIQDLSDKAGSCSTIATTANDSGPTSLVLSGSDMMTMNDQQWALALQVSVLRRGRVSACELT